MKEYREKKNEEKRVYEKPVLTKYGKLKDITAGESPHHMLGCSRAH